MTIDLSGQRRVYLVGIGGAGVSALARYLHAAGHAVAGSDQTDSPLLADLRAEGIAAQAGHDAARLLAFQPDLVIASAAIRPTQTELAAAHAAAIPIVSLADAVGAVAATKRTLAIAGTHGKTTTTSMLAHILEQAGLAPSFLLGGHAPGLGSNARLGDGSLLVIEADEYAGRFFTLRPHVAVVTNLEHDHPDVYPDEASLVDAFRRWLGQVQPGGLVLLRADDTGSQHLRHHLALAERVTLVTFAAWPHAADWTVQALAGGEATRQLATVRQNASAGVDLQLPLPGAYNLLNALAAVAVAATVGVAPARACQALATFVGVDRRFQLRGTVAGITVIDDYAHHPTALRLVIAAARERYPTARVCCVFQPHTFSRTRALFAEFATALATADSALVLPVYAAREPDAPAVTADRLATAAGPTVRAVADDSAAIAAALASVLPGDVILTVGAGTVTALGPRLLAAFRERDWPSA